MTLDLALGCNQYSPRCSVSKDREQPEDAQIRATRHKVAALLQVQQLRLAAKAIEDTCARLSGNCSAKEVQALTSLLPVRWHAQTWARLIERAEVPNPFSSRDGKLLRGVPPELHLNVEEVASKLGDAIESRLLSDSSELLTQAWIAGKRPGKAALAMMRSYAYLQAGRFGQALKDARAAAAYGPQTRKMSQWPRAFAAISAAIEGSQADNTQAALAMQKAVELQPGCAEFAADLERLLRRIPQHQTDALQAGGAEALEKLLAQEEEDALPEFRRKRPKYYYYYKWMRERVSQQCGELPEPVLDKVIRIDATELDMLLSYPKGIQRQAGKLLEVYEEAGLKGLEAFRLPLLTYSESQALKAEHAHLAVQGDKEIGALPDPRDLGQIIEEVYEEDAGETLEAEEDFDAIEVISSSQ